MVLTMNAGYRMDELWNRTSTDKVMPKSDVKASGITAGIRSRHNWERLSVAQWKGQDPILLSYLIQKTKYTGFVHMYHTYKPEYIEYIANCISKIRQIVAVNIHNNLSLIHI